MQGIFYPEEGISTFFLSDEEKNAFLEDSSIKDYKDYCKKHGVDVDQIDYEDNDTCFIMKEEMVALLGVLSEKMHIIFGESFFVDINLKLKEETKKYIKDSVPDDFLDKIAQSHYSISIPSFFLKMHDLFFSDIQTDAILEITKERKKKDKVIEDTKNNYVFFEFTLQNILNYLNNKKVVPGDIYMYEKKFYIYGTIDGADFADKSIEEEDRIDYIISNAHKIKDIKGFLQV